jgi:hypothetical protein
MAGLKVSTHENLVRETEQNMFYFTRKTYEFHVGCKTTRHTAPFLCPLTLSTGCNGAIDSRTDTYTFWPWSSIMWGHVVCAKTIWVMVIVSSVVTCTVLYRTSSILQTFNILPFLYENPVFVRCNPINVDFPHTPLYCPLYLHVGRSYEWRRFVAVILY